MPIPDCYDPDEHFRRQDLAYTARIMRRPRCQCCGELITTERYLDLTDFGLVAYACEKCVKNNSFDAGELDDDYT